MPGSSIRLGLIVILTLSTFYIIGTKGDSLSDLESTIITHGGQVLRVTDPQYKKAAGLWNPAIQIWPSLILRPAIYDDVALALSTLYSLNAPVRIMGGRHSYGAYCSHEGVVLDSALLKNIIINWQDQTVTMQAGVIWSEVYTALEGSEYVVIGGLCPTVGVVGYTMGGGYNSMYTRSFGLASDNVLSFTVALYNGSITTASSTINPDLYWALRGGGGGNFGYVLEMTHKIHQINATKLPFGQLLFFNVTWVNHGDFTAVLRNWLTFLKEVADVDTRISFDVIVIVAPENSIVMMYGSFNGPQADFNPVFDPWLSKNPKPDFFNMQNYTLTDIIRVVGVPNNPFPTEQRQHIVSAMAINITDAMLDVILEPQPNSTSGVFQVMDIIYLHNSNKDKNTAWPFSDISFDIAPGFVWSKAEDDPLAIDVSERWLQRLRNAAAPTQSIVGAYLNYIDPYLPDWQTMYYRNHWERLREINTKWDPTWYFRFPQGIPPNNQRSNMKTLKNMKMI
ncbi:unnamed protein product [Didymodactylos carnosus]|uniref:FAD-binding PCMH-type domain-containing protein n=1 Tax=Didymodactylos carnosus TaxID=1234261 RepID=A0A814WVA9_9BILA|nr:unnamed protein product [Didymodactylos carnosus]CAF1209260.1 unnamed protein product [Didymodactylos carnosus]CAF3825935.1 unnamed protein product [Didymodactylos carnosus]CAF3973362.1 unnamed protein product [Didymodactylos carnosus]